MICTHVVKELRSPAQSPLDILRTRAPRSVVHRHPAASRRSGDVVDVGEAGLRCGEMMALEWSDVDLAKRQVTKAKAKGSRGSVDFKTLGERVPAAST